MNLWSFLAAAVGPLAKRVLIALGFTIVSYAGLSPLVNSALANVTSNLGQLPTTAYALANYAGVTECIAILFAALTTRVALIAQRRLMLGGA